MRRLAGWMGATGAALAVFVAGDLARAGEPVAGAATGGLPDLVERGAPDADATAPAGPPTAPTESPAPPAEAAAKPDGNPLAFDVGNGFVLTPNAQYLLRYRYHQGHDFSEGNNANTLRHRARLGLDVTFDETVGVFVQLQDVRLFGEERNTLGDYSADGFDLHQGFAHVTPTKGLEFRLGRQEIAYENHRLIGTVGWVEQARAFDALRVSLDRGVLHWDAFYSKTGENASATTNADGEPFHTGDKDVMAFNLHVDPIEELGIGAIGVADMDWGVDRRLYTAGLLASAKLPAGISVGVEGYYQFGAARGDVEHSAYFLGAQAKAVFDVPTTPFLQLFGDFSSGDDDTTDTTVKVFDTLYATNHKFYGESDFFLNLPLNTGGRGLRDTGAKIGLRPIEMLQAEATYHLFGAMAVQADDLATFGHEVDVKVALKPWKPFSWDLVYALFVPEDIFEAGVADPRPEHFVYSTASVTF